MKPRYYIVSCFSAIIFIFFTSCYCDCIHENEQFFSLKNSKSKKSLLNGSEKIYSIDSIALYSLESKNGNNLKTEYKVESTTTDSVFVAYINTKDVKRYFISWNFQEIDTIDIETRNSSGRCCGEQRFIEKLYFNGNTCADEIPWTLLKK